MTRPRVFVVQDTIRFGPAGPEKKFDYRSAESFGDFVLLAGNDIPLLNYQPIIDDLNKKLSTYSDDDYLLLIGAQALIGITTAIAASYNAGRVNILVWNGRSKQYSAIRAQLWEEELV